MLAFFTVIQNGLIWMSRRWWAVVLVLLLNFAAFNILFALEDTFEAASGVPTFDTQNDLTPARLLEQLPLYTGEAREAYLRFSAFDFVFPLVAGTFLVVLWTLFLRANTWAFAGRMLRATLPQAAWFATIFDYMENFSLLTILNTSGTPADTLVNAAITFKQLKLAMLTASGAVSMVLLVLLVANVVTRLTQRHKGQTEPTARLTN